MGDNVGKGDTHPNINGSHSEMREKIVHATPESENINGRGEG